jgi:hypothetical protein
LTPLMPLELSMLWVRSFMVETDVERILKKLLFQIF